MGGGGQPARRRKGSTYRSRVIHTDFEAQGWATALASMAVCPAGHGQEVDPCSRVPSLTADAYLKIFTIKCWRTIY